jgi:DNA modification methylase
MKCLDEAHGERFAYYQGDCVQIFRQLPPASVDLVVTSPPFSGLYIYSDSEADMGNSASDEEFFAHFLFLARELHRVLRPGRLSVMHCKDLVYYQNAEGSSGLRDFPGQLLRILEQVGLEYHSRVTLWRCPVREQQKAKPRGLNYKDLRRDSTFSRQGLPEYLVLVRRWPENEKEEALVRPVTHTRESFPLEQWQRWASPVWGWPEDGDSLRETDVLNAAPRDPGDEKHICPLPLDIIRRAVTLWSNPGDVVADPFGGIGSVLYAALQLERRALGSELKASFFRQGAEWCRGVDSQARLFGQEGAA